jgi:hypothetical protein
MVITIHILILWVMMLCDPVGHFGGADRILHREFIHSNVRLVHRKCLLKQGCCVGCS